MTKPKMSASYSAYSDWFKKYAAAHKLGSLSPAEAKVLYDGLWPVWSSAWSLAEGSGYSKGYKEAVFQNLGVPGEPVSTGNKIV